MNTRWLVKIYRLVFSLLALSAIGVQFSVQLQKPDFRPADFFSFFTILSNILMAVVFMFGALRPDTASPSSRFDMLRGAAVSSMMLVGVVFSLLLSRLDSPVLPWVNIVVHYVMPVAAIADWLIDPPRARLSFRKALLWLGFPAAYLGHCVVISIGFVLVIWGVVAAGNWLRSRRHGEAATSAIR